MKHIYTIELDETYGPKLDAFAAAAGFESAEKLAARIVRDVLEALDEYDLLDCRYTGIPVQIGCYTGPAETEDSEDDFPF